MPDTVFVQEKLANGLTVVIEPMPHVRSAACGFLARTGSRDEPAALAGVSHFLEHMCFKGTPNRTSQQLDIEFDAMGAENNAHTSKDQTFYYSWARAGDLDRQLDLLADMMRSTLPPAELEIERKVILNEIAMYKDDLASRATDFLFENVCAGSSLAWPVIGYETTIREMTREQLHAYLLRRYSPGNLIVVVAGQVKPARVIKTVERVCGSWPGSAGPGRHQYRAQAAATGKSSSPGPGTASVPGGDDLADHRRPPKLQTGVAVRQLERFHQQALMLAFPSAPVAHRLDESAQAVAAILGGSNSRFYWNIVQQGLSARACVFREDYADFGLLVMPALCEPQNCEKLLDAMRHEARAMAAWGPEPKELQRVKNLRRTTLAAESEAPCYRLMQLADDLDYRGAPRTAEERLAAVEAVSSASIADYLREFPITGEGFLVSVGPRPWPAAE